MAFSATSGRIAVTDTDGHVVFDSNEGLFNGTDYVSGSITTAERYALTNASGPVHWENIDAETTLATVNSSANAVIGSFSVSSTVGSKGVAGLGWFSANGTYMHYLDARGPTTHPYDRNYMHDYCMFTFIASGGSLKLHERTVLDTPFLFLSGSETYRISIGAITLNYKLYVGTFT